MEPIQVQSRTLSSEDLAAVRAVIAEHPAWHRSALSRHLCALWNWRNGAGQFKDMAARTLLLKLQARGLIELPPPQTRTSRPRAQAPPRLQPEGLPGLPAPIHSPLSALQPLQWELADHPPVRRRVRQLLGQFHYRGFHGPVGENLQYLVRDVAGRELAVMVFGAAAWKVAVRDRFIGWSVEQRQRHLSSITNQQRFLILPWVRVGHLASHLLALAVRRLSRDWPVRYGHPVWLVESFVEKDRFAGTAYKAGGWICLGDTTGRTRQDQHRTLQTPVKEVWVRPVHTDFRPRLLSL
jgi:hypothetical protein